MPVADRVDGVFGFLEPAGCEVLVTQLQMPQAAAQLHPPAGGQAGAAWPVELGLDRIVELAVPFERLGVTADQPLAFFVELLQGGQSRERAPREGAIHLLCPSPEFEQIMWDV